MGIKAHFLQDKNHEKFYPYGHAGAIYDKDGNTVQSRLDEITNNIKDLGDAQPDWNENNTSDPSFIKNKPGNATTGKDGFMSSADKTKLDGIESGATKTVIDTSLNSSSTNPVQNKVVNSALLEKVPTTRTVNGKSLSTNISLSASDVGAIPTIQKGATNGVAELDSTGKVPSSQLPSFVDDVIEGYLSGEKFYKESAHTNEIMAEAGKIYVDLSTNKTYRWSGSAYAEISASLALGETSSTAYRGDYGKIAYAHSQSAHAPSNAEANVQSDWSVSDTGSDAYIKNKPTSLPANGGNASTVNGHSVQSDVPANAVFTDTKPVTMKGATASASGSAGYVPAPASGSNTKYLRGDGTWSTPPDTNTTYEVATSSSNGLLSSADKTKLDGIAIGANKYVHPSYTAKSSGLYKVTVDATGHVSAVDAVTKSDITSLGIPGSDTNTWTPLKGATTETDGTAGYAPAPTKGAANRYLRSDGTWQVPPSASLSTLGITATATELNYMDGVTSNVQTQLNGKASTEHTHNYAGSTSAGGAANSAVKLDTSTAGKATQPVYFSGGKPVACTYTLEKSVPSNAVFTDTNTWIALKGATTSAAGTAGYAPAPSAGPANRYLRSDGTWAVPPDTNTTYSNMKAATSSAAGSSGLVPAPEAGKQTSFLRGDGTWAIPTDTKYTLSSFGITATASELNYVDGVTSNIQTQLNSKASTSHQHLVAQESEPSGQNIGDFWFIQD